MLVYVYAMEISFVGHSSFRLKGKTATVVTDPYGLPAGKFPKDISADIVTISHQHDDHNVIDNIKSPIPGGSVFKIEYPGEYEVKGVSVIGVASWHDEVQGEKRGKNTMYVIEMDGLRIAHLGDLGEKLTAEQLEEIGSVDVLMVPVGGVYTIDAKVAAEVVKQIDPWVAIPMHFADDALDQTVFSELGNVTEFLKIMDKTNVEPVAKYSIFADKLPTEFSIVWLNRK